jgi:hypothetical protein
VQLNPEPRCVIENALDCARWITLDERAQFREVRRKLAQHFDGNVSAVWQIQHAPDRFQIFHAAPK